MEKRAADILATARYLVGESDDPGDRVLLEMFGVLEKLWLVLDNGDEKGMVSSLETLHNELIDQLRYLTDTLSGVTFSNLAKLFIAANEWFLLRRRAPSVKGTPPRIYVNLEMDQRAAQKRDRVQISIEMLDRLASDATNRGSTLLAIAEVLKAFVAEVFKEEKAHAALRALDAHLYSVGFEMTNSIQDIVLFNFSKLSSFTYERVLQEQSGSGSEASAHVAEVVEIEENNDESPLLPPSIASGDYGNGANDGGLSTVGLETEESDNGEAPAQKAAAAEILCRNCNLAFPTHATRYEHMRSCRGRQVGKKAIRSASVHPAKQNKPEAAKGVSMQEKRRASVAVGKRDKAPPPEDFRCVHCDRSFGNAHGKAVHQGKCQKKPAGWQSAKKEPVTERSIKTEPTWQSAKKEAEPRGEKRFAAGGDITPASKRRRSSSRMQSRSEKINYVEVNSTDSDASIVVVNVKAEPDETPRASRCRTPASASVREARTAFFARAVKCPLCDVHFFNAFKLTTHVTGRHIKAPHAKFSCSDCSRSVTSMYTMERHFIDHPECTRMQFIYDNGKDQEAGAFWGESEPSRDQGIRRRTSSATPKRPVAHEVNRISPFSSQDGSIYNVERILDKRETKNGSIEYLFKWLNYPESQSTWEPESHAASCPLLIAQFEESRQKSVGRGRGMAPSVGEQTVTFDSAVDCDHCELSFTDAYKLHEHLDLYGNKDLTAHRSYTCLQCTKTGKDLKTMWRHYFANKQCTQKRFVYENNGMSMHGTFSPDGAESDGVQSKKKKSLGASGSLTLLAKSSIKKETPAFVDTEEGTTEESDAEEDAEKRKGEEEEGERAETVAEKTAPFDHPVDCGCCDDEFDDAFQLCMHNRSRYVGPLKKLFSCVECGKKTKTIWPLEKHFLDIRTKCSQRRFGYDTGNGIVEGTYEGISYGTGEEDSDASASLARLHRAAIKKEAPSFDEPREETEDEETEETVEVDGVFQPEMEGEMGTQYFDGELDMHWPNVDAYPTQQQEKPRAVRKLFQMPTIKKELPFMNEEVEEEREEERGEQQPGEQEDMVEEETSSRLDGSFNWKNTKKTKLAPRMKPDAIKTLKQKSHAISIRSAAAKIERKAVFGRPVPCPHCTLFISLHCAFQLSKHLEEQHGGLHATSFSCIDCNTSVASMHSLEKHFLRNFKCKQRKFVYDNGTEAVEGKYWLNRSDASSPSSADAAPRQFFTDPVVKPYMTKEKELLFHGKSNEDVEERETVEVEEEMEREEEEGEMGGNESGEEEEQEQPMLLNSYGEGGNLEFAKRAMAGALEDELPIRRRKIKKEARESTDAPKGVTEEGGEREGEEIEGWPYMQTNPRGPQFPPALRFPIEITQIEKVNAFTGIHYIAVVRRTE